MKLQTFAYESGKWSVNKFPEMDSPNTVVFVFGAPMFIDKQDSIKELKKAYPKSICLGCSTSGEIHGNRIFDNSLSVAVAQFEKTTVRYAESELQSAENSFAAGKKIAETLAKKDLKGIFLLSDGLHVNGSELVKGINATVGSDVIVTGGLAGDGSRFQKTWIIQDSKLKSNCVTAIGFYGNNVKILHGSKGGWDIFGPSRVITKSSGNILYELDGKPALDLYKQYLGERAKELPASGLLFPLSIKESATAPKSLVRTILAVDDQNKSLTFAGDVPQGWIAQLMHANFDRLIDGASSAAEMAALNSSEQDPALLISISCVGRRLVLGERSEEEVEATILNFKKNIQQVGFYSYGEISPSIKGQSCDLHNQTMTLTIFSEAA